MCPTTAPAIVASCSLVMLEGLCSAAECHGTLLKPSTTMTCCEGLRNAVKRECAAEHCGLQSSSAECRGMPTTCLRLR